jgi:predicted nucleic-acid-binding protein
VRFLIRDDEAQALRAARLIAAGGQGGSFVSVAALVETVWILERTYGFERPAIVTTLEKLLSTDEFVLEGVAHVRSALVAYAASSADFADALIGEVNRAAGCSSTATFDRKAARLDGFSRVP